MELWSYPFACYVVILVLYIENLRISEKYSASMAMATRVARKGITSRCGTNFREGRWRSVHIERKRYCHISLLFGHEIRILAGDDRNCAIHEVVAVMYCNQLESLQGVGA